MSLPIASIVPPELVLPGLVFLAETCVLTLATMRTISIARGKKLPAALLGFFEVSIWLFAIGQVMQNLNNLSCAVAFAAGFSLGNFLGVLIEQKLALGSLKIQITTKRDARELIDELRSAGYGVTKLDGQGATGPVQVVMTIVQRKNLPHVCAIIRRFDPGAFFAVHDIQSFSEGIFPRRTALHSIPIPLMRMFRVAEARGPQANAHQVPVSTEPPRSTA